MNNFLFRMQNILFLGSTSQFAGWDVKHVNTYNKFYKGYSAFDLERERERIRDLKQRDLPKVNLHTFKGMAIMDEVFPRGDSTVPLAVKPKYQVRQVDKFYASMKNAKERVCLLVIGTNDFKSFLVRNNKKLKAGSSFKRKWDKLSLSQKVKFSAKTHRLVSRTVLDHMKDQIDKFVDKVKVVAEECKFDVILLSSLLERNYDKVGYKHLDFWFAHLNHLLYKALKKLELSVCNANGKFITWEFVNVSEQYYMAQARNNVASLYRRNERISGELTHRNIHAYRELIDLYMREVHKYVE